MSSISDIHARQILDSRGNPTVEADVVTEKGLMGRAAGIHAYRETRALRAESSESACPLGLRNAYV